MNLESRTNRARGKITPLVKEHILLADAAANWPLSLKENLSAVVDVVARLEAYIRARKVRFSVVMIPAGFAWADEVVQVKQARGYDQKSDFTVSQDGLETYLAERFESLGIRWLNPRSPFEAAKEASGHLLFNEADGHLNVKRHTVMFEYLQDHFVTQASNIAPH